MLWIQAQEAEPGGPSLAYVWQVGTSERGRAALGISKENRSFFNSVFR